MCSAPPNHPTTQILEPPPRRAGKQPPCILRRRSLFRSLCAVLTPATACASRYIHEDSFGVLSAVCVLAPRARRCARGFILALAGGSKSRGSQFAAVAVRGWKSGPLGLSVFLPLFVDTSHGNRSYLDAIVSRELCRSRVPLENCQNWIYRTLVNKGPPNGHNECFGLCLASIFVPNSRASRIKPKVSVEILKC